MASKRICLDFGRDLYKSKAWISLTGKATQVYTILLTKRVFATKKIKGQKMSICTNCQQLEFTYLEAERLGIAKGQFTRAIDRLVRCGFIGVVYTGGGYQRDKSRYGLIDNWRHYGTDNFKPGRPREADPLQRGYRKPNGLKIFSRVQNQRT